MSVPRHVPPALFPETDELYPSVIYWAQDTLRLVYLVDDGLELAAEVSGISELHARILLREDAVQHTEDPWVIIDSAQKFVSSNP